MTTDLQAAGRTYRVRTYGCQMNVHDSERLSGLLEAAGYAAAPEGEDADVVVLNTCAVRENADNRLYGNLGHLRPVKDAHPGMQIAVGGCLAQKDRGEIVRRAPWVDVVFGTHNVGSLPALLERARHNAEAQVEIKEALEVFPSTLPAKRDSAYSGWVSISVGCHNTCTFCIVPSLRGKEKDRRPGEILAETPAVCHQLHMPLQSGSDDVLRRMRRAYRQERYLGIIDRVRAAMPDAAITTDIIVGFPGETEEDFQQTLDVVRQARFASAFTFQYSKRPGTPAAEMEDQLPKAVVQERYLRLTALQEDISWSENRAQVGRTVELLVAAGEGSKDAATGRLSGRARDGRLVHFTAAPGVRPGDVVETVVTQAAPHHLVADGPLLSHRRTRAGDASEAGTRPTTPGVLLGMPRVGAPA